jgi:1-aminocyclopropane-1-carboxylate deaminase/D-cysteine desulfhydrase-like pyridoxal-dependent ACC family enzyme
MAGGILSDQMSLEELRNPSGSRVLYAHLGGQPALSAYAHTPGLGG